MKAIQGTSPPGKSFLEVREQLLEFRERLRHPETPAKLGEPLSGHNPIEPTTLADAVDGEISAYDTLMEETREQQKRTEESGILRKKALDDHRRVVVNVSRVQEGYYRLVGGRGGREGPPGELPASGCGRLSRCRARAHPPTAPPSRRISWTGCSA